MIPLESAILIQLKRAEKLQGMIQANEAAQKIMDKRKRAELGSIRCLLFRVGVPKEKLPEVPYLDPEHLAAYRAQQAERRAKALEVAG